MKVAVIGTGYVGLVTGVCLSDIGHSVTCVDIDEEKVGLMRQGISPIYEPGLSELMIKNSEEERLHFTTSYPEALKYAEAVYIAVGTPENEDGSANLTYVERVAKTIAQNVQNDITIVTKSTVPVGTNDWILETVRQHLKAPVEVRVASNPEFLREGSAIHDTFNGDRIVIGSDSKKAIETLKEINAPFSLSIVETDVRSAEMIKYASNAFLATKISFINEISNICEKVGANVQDVAEGMGKDKRIGDKFLNAGIGYGGSCFPKDTKALVQLAGNVDYDFNLLKSVIEVNNYQQQVLFDKLKEEFGSLAGKRIAMLGLSFKPNTDDMREAPSIPVSQKLIEEGAEVIGYDPIALENAKRVLPGAMMYRETIEETLEQADAALIMTEWDDIKSLTPVTIKNHMKDTLIFDGRNCVTDEVKEDTAITVRSMGFSNESAHVYM